MEEDESVILKDSPLYSYLHDVGFTDFEVSVSQNHAISLEKKILECKINNEKAKISIGTFYLWLMNLCRYVEFKNYILRQSAMRLMKSKLLIENDRLILEYLCKTVDNLIINQQLYDDDEHQKYTLYSIFDRRKYFVLISFLFGLLAFFLQNVVVSFVLGSTFVIFLLCYLLRVPCEKDHDYFIGLIQAVQNAFKIIIKSCKTINEIQVIGKGFAKEGSHPDISNEVCLMEGALSLIESFSLMYIAGHSTIEKRRLSSEWKSITELFVNRFFPINCNSEEKGILSTLLKVKLNLLIDQSSAFLTELLLHLEKDYEHNYRINISEIIPAKHLSTINKKLELLIKLEKLANNYWFDKKELKPVLSSLPPTCKSMESVKTDVTGGLDSLYIHSRLAVNNILLLRKLLEENTEIISDGSKKDLLNKINKNCDAIKSEFQSSLACLEEVWDRAQHLYFPACDQPEALPKGFVCDRDLKNDSNHHCLPLIGLKDNVVVDEVFEAIVGEPHNVSTKDENTAWISNNKLDKFSKRRQMERCKRVLQEIQPILQQRREMWEEREKIAMELKNRRSTDTSGCSADTYEVMHVKQEENKEIEEIPLIAPNKYNLLKKEENDATISSLALSCEDEYDSDEERLKVYRKVRRELDEDERIRDLDEVEVNDDLQCEVIGNKEIQIYVTDKNCILRNSVIANHNINYCCKPNIDNKISYYNDCDSETNKFTETNNQRNTNDKDCNAYLDDSVNDKTVQDENKVNNSYLMSVDHNSDLCSDFNKSHNTTNIILNCHNNANELKSEISEDELSCMSAPSSPSLSSTNHDLASSILSSISYPSLTSSLSESPASKKSIETYPTSDTTLAKAENSENQLFSNSLNAGFASMVNQGYSPMHKRTEQNSNFFCNLGNTLSESPTNKTFEYGNNDIDDNCHAIDWSTGGHASYKKASETFICGSNDDSQPVDWSTCGFRRISTHERGPSSESINPFLSLEALQRRNVNLNEVVFGGVGEGEELQEEKEDLEEWK